MEKKTSKACIVIGLSGNTCSGKTTTANKLKSILNNRISIISQDDYFKEKNHCDLEYIHELDCFNYDSLTCLNMSEMYSDILKLLNSSNNQSHILLIEGFSILNFKPIKDLCDLKIYMILDYETTRVRRESRTYLPPDKPGYFEKTVWPQHLKHLRELLDDRKDCVNLHVINLNSNQNSFDEVRKIIEQFDSNIFSINS